MAALLILAAGAAFAGLSVAIGGGQAADTIAAYRTGVAGQAGITLVSLAYGPNARGLGGRVPARAPASRSGTDSAVRLTEVTVGPLPTAAAARRPAGRPDGRAPARRLLAVPVLAAMVAGWLLTRRRCLDCRATVHGRTATAGEPAGRWCSAPAVLAGPVAGVVLGLLAWMSGGPLGAGRLAEIGPVPWQVGLVAAAVVTVSAASARPRPRLPPARADAGPDQTGR